MIILCSSEDKNGRIILEWYFYGTWDLLIFLWTSQLSSRFYVYWGSTVQRKIKHISKSFIVYTTDSMLQLSIPARLTPVLQFNSVSGSAPPAMLRLCFNRNTLTISPSSHDIQSLLCSNVSSRTSLLVKFLTVDINCYRWMDFIRSQLNCSSGHNSYVLTANTTNDGRCKQRSNVDAVG